MDALGVGNWELGVDRDGAIGSNSWAISGRLTADGRALVANDMHLTVRVPNTWYRAVARVAGRAERPTDIA